MELINDTWKYISIAGALFAINAVDGFAKFNMGIQIYYLWDISEAILFATFITMIYQWYMFIGGLIVQTEKQSK